MDLSTQNIILNHQQIGYIIQRIAYQIYEHNAEESEIVLAGISKEGLELTKKIKTELENISSLKIILCEVYINKKNPLAQSISTSIPLQQVTEKSLVLMDDVLNSGRTLLYGISHFLQVPLKKCKTAVLVNRNHKKYPIKADFKGISLSTSTLEHVKVSFTPNNFSAVLY